MWLWLSGFLTGWMVVAFTELGAKLPFLSPSYVRTQLVTGGTKGYEKGIFCVCFRVTCIVFSIAAATQQMTATC